MNHACRVQQPSGCSVPGDVPLCQGWVWRGMGGIAGKGGDESLKVRDKPLVLHLFMIRCMHLFVQFLRCINFKESILVVTLPYFA